MGSALPLRILVADDDQDAGDLVELMLIGLGHDVHVVADGDAAVRYARERPLDLILMDIGMPGLNGYEATRQIRARGTGQPVIAALTSWNRDEDRARGREAGMNHYLPKPFEPEALKAILDLVSNTAASAATGFASRTGSRSGSGGRT
jgi:CheY-like chemotaxis protein